MAHLKDLIVNGASRFIGKAYGAFVGSFSGNLDGNATTSTTANIAKACSGNSATATTASKVYGIYTANGGQQGPGYFGTNSAGCLMSNQPINGHDEYKNWLYMDNYDGSDVGGATAIGISRTETRAYIMSSNADRKQWDRSAELLSSANYNSFAPTKTGGGASGTWGINISGNAVNDGNGANIANTYLKKSGGNMSGPLNFANATWNLVGDDSYMGDHNIGGTFCIKGANDNSGIALINVNNEADYARISYGGGNINFNKKIGGNLAGNADTATNANYANSAGSVAWSNITNRPSVVGCAGDTMTGNLQFAGIEDVAKSAGITWNGSTDGADIYYQTTASDQGNLVFNLRDDANCYLRIAANGVFKSYFSPSDGNFHGNVNGTATTALNIPTSDVGGNIWIS